MSRPALPLKLSLSRRNRARNRRSFVPGQVGLAVLESRVVLSTTGITATLSADGVLTVTGTHGDDTINVVQEEASIIAAGEMFDTSLVKSIMIKGLDGNDLMNVQTTLPIPATLNGGGGLNTYVAPPGDTVIDLIMTAGRSMSKAVMDKYQSFGGEDNTILGKPLGDEVAAYGGRVVHFQFGEIDYSASTGAHEVNGLIASKLNSSVYLTDASGHSVRGILGLATSDEMDGPVGGRVSHFLGGDIDWSPATGAHTIIGAIDGDYAATAYQVDAFGTSVQQILGLPISDETNVPGVVGARMQTFQGGTIYSSSGGAHPVFGAIGADYAATAVERDAFGNHVQKLLGMPTGDETDVLGVPGARMQTFQGGTIYYSPTAGTHVIIGAIAGEYDYTRFEGDLFGTSVQTILGLPTGEETNVPGVSGARMQTFQGGTIYSSGSGTYAVYGAIGGQYAATAYQVDAFGKSVQKILGMPTSEEMNVPGVPGARMQTFQGGTIYSSSVGTHAVIGAIAVEYATTASETDAFGTNVQTIVGMPTSDEMNVPGVPGARMQTFQGGTIYYSGLGTHVIIGAILQKYNAMGGPAGILGLPLNDEEFTPSGARTVAFQNGEIFWSQETGAEEAIQISGIPGGSPQIDNTTCGPNTASRFLRFYGFNQSYAQMMNQIEYDGDLVSRVGMGTRPSVMLAAIQKYRPQTTLEARVNRVNYGDGGIDHILDILATGRPVIALINPTGQNRTIPTGHLPEDLHWIVLTGYDRFDRTVTLTNTDGNSYTESFDQFYTQWNWSADGAVGDILTGDFDVQPRTIIY